MLFKNINVKDTVKKYTNLEAYPIFNSKLLKTQ